MQFNYDCLTIALAKKIDGIALFLKKEKEFEKILVDKSTEIEFLFFNELVE